MMTRLLSATAATLMVLSMAACTNTQGTNAAAGAVVGGVIGNQFGSGSGNTAATIAGAAAGAAIASNATQ